MSGFSHSVSGEIVWRKIVIWVFLAEKKFVKLFSFSDKKIKKKFDNVVNLLDA